MPVALAGGQINVGQDRICENVRGAIRRQLPVARPHDINGRRIAIVAGGPSLNDTLDELVAQIARGDSVVAVNGAYRWLLERNIQPRNMVMVDARAFNARFVQPASRSCKYFISSQCDPAVFDALAGHDVTLFHSFGDDSPEKAIVDEFYFRTWHSVSGTTVTIQAIQLMRMLGYVRMDLYGFDSCWMGDEHHAYPQDENAADARRAVWLVPRDRETGAPDESRKRRFLVAPWHIKQLEQFQQMIRHGGDQLLLDVHGDGLIATMMRTAATLQRLEDDHVD